MKKSSLIDYLACILFRVLGAILRLLPVELSLFLGRRLGDAFYYFDFKHRARAYSNIKIAFGRDLPSKELAKITKGFYRSFGSSLIEIFIIPKVDKAYMDKYIDIEGLENIYGGLKKGKGVILLSIHAGSWELANIICGNLGFPFYLFVKEQSLPRLNELLNKYRLQKGCRIITKEGGLKQLVEAIKNNASVGITLDQGGKSGELTEFFNRPASMSTGGIKIALKYGSSVVPVYFTRIRGPKIKVIVGKEIELIRSSDPEKELKDNLKMITGVFEDLITKYPQDYLWTYKIWKYSDEKNILILSDGKAGHLRQSEGAARVIGQLLKNKGIQAKVNTAQVTFKTKLARSLLSFSSLLSGKYNCQGCLMCLRKFLQEDTYKQLSSFNPDIVISCGSGTAALNAVISTENQSKSIAIMRPGLLNTNRFNLVIMPQHDHPPEKKNIVVTKAALNLINEEYLQEQSKKLSQYLPTGFQSSGLHIGLLIGGDTKDFLLDKEIVLTVIQQIKSVCEKAGADILLTTSRRTPKDVEELIKQEFKDYPAAKLLIIANEKNIPEAVGGILGLSNIIISSPESISMISEAASSGKYVLVFNVKGLSRKHKEFLANLEHDRHIILSEANCLAAKIEDLWRNKPAINMLKDNQLIARAIDKIL